MALLHCDERMRRRLSSGRMHLGESDSAVRSALLTGTIAMSPNQSRARRCREDERDSAGRGGRMAQAWGGLLGAVKPERARETLTQLHQAGFSRAAVIGEVIAVQPGQGPAIYLE